MLFRELLAAGVPERRAVQLQNLAIHCGYATFGLNRADAEFCIATRSLSRTETLAHEDMAHDIVYERRMHAVPAEETGPGEPVAQLSDPPVKFQTEFMAADSHNRYFFNSPARRPVEKAIWRL